MRLVVLVDGNSRGIRYFCAIVRAGLASGGGEFVGTVVNEVDPRFVFPTNGRARSDGRKYAETRQTAPTTMGIPKACEGTGHPTAPSRTSFGD